MFKVFASPFVCRRRVLFKVKVYEMRLESGREFVHLSTGNGGPGIK